ncbi:MAG TPA: hypothetical protein VMM78_02075, partial [Thermomicrobiales bacterium]|nr:hypothetical protein [Thermomicrobiales bacterium]
GEAATDRLARNLPTGMSPCREWVARRLLSLALRVAPTLRDSLIAAPRGGKGRRGAGNPVASMRAM